MSEPIKVTLKQAEPMTAAFLGAKGGLNQIPAAFNRLYSWIREKGYKAKGPAILVYYDLPGQISEDELRWELRSQISENIDSTEPDNNGPGIKRLQPVQVATTIYKGPYEKIEETYISLTNWILENDYEITGPYEEAYLNSSSNPEELLTELRFPIRKKQAVD